ncbi:peptide MFS transporter [Nocardioides sp. WG-D5]|uniref:peptide MFS transporter n=1 Tax=Nocardioides luteus TaxID=1844 RepID=UPI0002029202|nr:oligopeptide:H+ symporter [Nocardioides luteus]EGD43770.1 di-/tripeptide transporter [Nocardioidaceae bacterium Broad-1]MBG6095629.1 POT family proton-dependent oligopeptide transporter [Nocardioides luteus]
MSQLKSETTAGDPGERSFLGQPRVLANLFGVELWERFSFYGMQGILAIYLYYSAAQGGLGISETVALGIVGAYGGAVYLSTIIAAWIADRLLGAERTLFASACLVVLGHLGLALIPGIAGVGVGLVLIALGSGGVKANASSLVGTLYAADDERRDAGFSLFYLGINLGALVGPLLTGLLQKQWGFHFGFGLAAVGMILGLVQYAVGRRALPAASRVVPNPLPAAERGRWIGIAVAAVALIVVLCLTGVITAPRLANIVIGISIVAAVALFAVILSSRLISSVERSRVWAMVPLFVASAVFWSLYQQQFTVMVVYSDQRLDRDIFGWEMPVSWVNSINPVFIILLAGVFAALWTKLGSRQPSTPVKFGLGTILMGLAFWAFLLMPSGAHSVPLIGLAFILLLFTLAELLLSPVGLSLATKLAPQRFQTQMMALFFLSVALGTAMSGRLAEFYDVSNDSGFFWWVGLASVVVGVLLLVGNRPIRRLMAGVH